MGKRRASTLRTTTLILAFLLTFSSTARAETDPAFVAAATFDVLILRSCGFAASVVVAALLLPTALMTAPNGRDSLEEAWEQFVVGPAEYVYSRPLGEF